VIPQSIDAAGVAERLWARAANGATAPAEVAVAADRMCSEIGAGLRRWIGTAGYSALLDRALAQSRFGHPVLEGLSCLGADASTIADLVRERGAGEISAGLVAVVRELVELLGRIIGPELVMHLVEQISLPSPRGVVSTRPQGGRDDD
jgi:hypothetical protein